MIASSGLNMSEFEWATNRIIESCTKDAIAVSTAYPDSFETATAFFGILNHFFQTGRSLVFDKAPTEPQVEALCYYLTLR